MSYPGREEGYSPVTELLTFSPIKWHFDTKGLTGARLSSKMRPAFGDWRSLVAHFVRDEGVGGSNPLSPTKFKTLLNEQGFLHLKPTRMRTSGGRGSTRAQRENVASATARRASHAVASNPLSPTKFKTLLNEQGFLFCRPDKRSAIRQYWRHCRMAAQAPYAAYRLSFIPACMALFQPHL